MFMKKILSVLILSLFMISCGGSISSNENERNPTDSDIEDVLPQTENPWLDMLIHIAVDSNNFNDCFIDISDGDIVSECNDNFIVFDKDFNIKQALPVSIKNKSNVVLLDNETLYSSSWHEGRVYKKIDGLWALYEKFSFNSPVRNILPLDNNTLVLNYHDETISIQEKNGDKWEETKRTPKYGLVGALALIDNNSFAFSYGRTIEIWEKTGSEWIKAQTVNNDDNNERLIGSLSVVEKGKKFISCSYDYTKVWEKIEGNWKETEKMNNNTLLVLLDNGSLMSFGVGIIFFWEKTNGVWAKNFNRNLKMAYDFTPKDVKMIDNKTIITVSKNSAYFKIEKIGDEWKKTQTYRLQKVKATSFLPMNDKTVATATYNGSIVIWKKKKNVWKQIEYLFGHTVEVASLISIDDDTMASGSKDEVVIWKKEKGLWEHHEEYATDATNLFAINSETFAVIKSENNVTKTTIWGKSPNGWVPHLELAAQAGKFEGAAAVNDTTFVVTTSNNFVIWEKDGHSWKEAKKVNAVFNNPSPINASSFVVGAGLNGMIIYEKDEIGWKEAEKINKYKTDEVVVIDNETIIQKQNNVYTVWKKTEGEWKEAEEDIKINSNKIIPVKDGFLYMDQSFLRSHIFKKDEEQE